MPTRGASPLHAFAGLWWGVSLQHRPVQSSGRRWLMLPDTCAGQWSVVGRSLPNDAANLLFPLWPPPGLRLVPGRWCSTATPVVLSSLLLVRKIRCDCFFFIIGKIMYATIICSRGILLGICHNDTIHFLRPNHALLEHVPWLLLHQLQPIPKGSICFSLDTRC
jgi:hypothetical protein